MFDTWGRVDTSWTILSSVSFIFDLIFIITHFFFFSICTTVDAEYFVNVDTNYYKF